MERGERGLGSWHNDRCTACSPWRPERWSRPSSGPRRSTGHALPRKNRPVKTKKMSGVKVSTLLSRAPSNWPAWLKTVRLKLLWLSAMQISPEAVSPTPIGKLLTVEKQRNRKCKFWFWTDSHLLRHQSDGDSFLGNRIPWHSVPGCRWCRSPCCRWQQLRWGTPGSESSWTYWGRCRPCRR